MYFALLASSALYSVLFLFSKVFLRKNGSPLMPSLVFSAAFSAILAVYGFAIVGFRPELTPFAIILAGLYGICQVACVLCGFLAMSRVSLLRLSVFMMLGGMAVPAAYGAIFRAERFSLWQIVCFVLIAASLVLTWEGKREKKGTLPLLFAIFVSGGIIGLLSKLHGLSEDGVDSFSFIALFSAFTAIISVAIIVALVTIKKQPLKIRPDSYLLPAGFAFCFGMAMTLTLTAANAVPESHRYAVIAGGTVVFSAAISAIIGEKPRLRGIIAVLVAVCASVCMVL